MTHNSLTFMFSPWKHPFGHRNGALVPVPTLSLRLDVEVLGSNTLARNSFSPEKPPVL